MNLDELAAGCKAYEQLARYDISVRRLRAETGEHVDPNEPGAVEALLAWLRAWGCRQFRPSQDDVAVASITSWWARWGDLLPPVDARLELLGHAELRTAAQAYDDLSSRRASGRSNSPFVAVGPTGAAKALYAIRPNTLAPWDDPIRKALGYSAERAGYERYVSDARLTVIRLRREAEERGLDPDDLPRILGRAESSLPKMIDEYHWATITRGADGLQ